MIEIIWECVVKDQARGLFELAHGPGGAWSKVLGRSPGFRGLTLLRDMRNACRYLVVEVWEREDQREQTLALHKDEYAAVDAALGEWTEARTLLGAFALRAEATVRSPVRVGRVVDEAKRGRGIL